MLPREAIRSELGRLSIIEAKFQTVDRKAHIRLNVNQLSLREQLMVRLPGVWELELAALLQPADLQRHYLACGHRFRYYFILDDFYTLRSVLCTTCVLPHVLYVLGLRCAHRQIL